MLTIDAQLKNGDLSRFQLLYGEEAYLVRNYKNKLKQALSVPGKIFCVRDAFNWQYTSVFSRQTSDFD